MSAEYTLQAELSFATELALREGAVLLDYFHQPQLAADIKGDGTPVTDADQAIHNHITTAYGARGLPVASEEGNPTGSYCAPVVCVDPVDGTKDVLLGMLRDPRISCAAVSLGQLVDNELSLGVVNFPLLATPRLYTGATGMSAQRTIGTETATIEVDRSLQKGAVLISESPHPDFSAIREDGDFTTVAQGGSVFKALCVVDQSLWRAFDPDRIPPEKPIVGFVSHNTWPHDTAATAAIAKAAGGIATRIDGGPLGIDYARDMRGCIFAVNEAVHARLLTHMSH
jgi:fructose-1,6-bisphosphatase/inositol monophosphatase family enzyme